MFAIRKHATTHRFKGILDASNVNDAAPQRLFAFPDTPQDLDEDILKGLWMHMGGLEVVVHLHSFAQELLPGTSAPALFSKLSMMCLCTLTHEDVMGI